MFEELLTRFRDGDRRALSRLLTLAVRGQLPSNALRQISTKKNAARVIAFTGGAGVGKSTLIGKLIEHIRRAGRTVAVLACDPESPLSGGALLGDRFRMAVAPDDDGVFIRSLAAVGGHSGLADRLHDLVHVVEAFGFDIVLIETVGAGQGDTAVRSGADVVVLLLQPHTGDDLQWEKAGVLEVADVVAIHKADMPGADQVEAQVRATLELGAHPPPIVAVSSRTGSGIDRLWEAIAAIPARSRDEAAQELLRLAQQTLAARFVRAVADTNLEGLVERWRNSELAEEAAIAELWELLTRAKP